MWQMLYKRLISLDKLITQMFLISFLMFILNGTIRFSYCFSHRQNIMNTITSSPCFDSSFKPWLIFAFFTCRSSFMESEGSKRKYFSSTCHGIFMFSVTPWKRKKYTSLNEVVYLLCLCIHMWFSFSFCVWLC